MKRIFYVCFMVGIWIINLFNGTGLGAIYQTTEITKLVLLLLVSLSVIGILGKNNKINIDKKEFYAFILMFLFFVGDSYFKGQGLACFEYMWVYLLVFFIGDISVDRKTVKYIGLCYGLLGLFILFIYNYGSVLSGWNSNSIGMIGMQSFLVFLIPHFGITKRKGNCLLLVVTILYMYFLYPTDSRSSLLFGIVGVLFAISVLSTQIVFKSKLRLVICLLLPLIVATVVVLISPTTLVQELNTWSLLQFDKPLFNGRDEIWSHGFKMIFKQFFCGTAKIYSGYWHNSAIACLTAFGVIGYTLWIRGFYVILDKGKPWQKDYIVMGATVMFLVLYVQQSVELGIFAPNPSLLPYAMLSILLGRIKYLRRKNGECTN